MALSKKQIEFLMRPLHANRVSLDGKRHSHVEAWDIRRYLNRVFGFGGWDLLSISTEPVSETQNEKKQWTVIYRATSRLVIKDPEGNVMASYDGVATGAAPNQKSLADAHDLALKTADSQAMKRAAMNLGDQFGLSLYNDGSTDPVGLWTLVPEMPPTVDVDKIADAEKVEPGEDSPLAEPEPEPIVERRSAPLVREPAVVKPPKPSGVKPEASEAAVNLSRSAQQCRSREGAVSVRQKIWAAHTRGEVTDHEFEKLSGYINTIIDKYQEVNA